MVQYKYLIIAGLLVLFAVLVSASFDVGSPGSSINSVYGPAGTVAGWINLSFSNQAGNSLFGDSFGNSIRLIDLLGKRNSYDYDCSPIDCLYNYVASNGEVSKTFSLSSGNSVLYGIRFTGNLVAINNISFDFVSDAQISNKSQIKIDILDDGTTEFINNKVAPGPGDPTLKSYGCFETGQSSEEHTLTNTPYCQKVKFSESPGFSVGAWVKKISGTLNMSVSVYDGYLEVGSCILPDASTSGSEISCDINYSVSKSKDHYVCIYSNSGVGNYKIKGYSDPSGCGFFQTGGIPPPSTTAAYQIFAEGKKFDSIGTLKIKNLLKDGQSLNQIFNSYIFDKYGDYNCIEGCVVPVRFTSGSNQQITLQSLSAEYEKDTGIVSENRFYDLTETPALITSDYQKIYLDEANFTLPEEFGAYELILSLDGSSILSKEINIEDVPQILSLKPTSTASAFPTPFIVNVTSQSDVKKYQWNFGDSISETTTINEVKHTYASTGNYSLTITITDVDDFISSKTFNIIVSSPKDLINTTLKEMKSNIENIKSQISEFDLFTRQSINNALRINTSEFEIERLKIEYEDATSEAEYNQIITDLLNLNVPASVAESAIATAISFFPQRGDIEPEILQILGGINYDSGLKNQYKESILFWHQENLDTKLNFKEFSGEYDQSTLPFLRIFEIDINEISNPGYDYYLVIPELYNLKFDGITERNSGGYVYAEISGKSKVSFSTSQDVDFTNIPAFITPGIERLSIIESSPEEPEDNTYFILAIVLLVIIGIVVYIILQQWYKKKYESHLFKNRNDLYNMVHYVNNAKKKGLTKGEMGNNLKRAGWSSEQIRYVIRKYAGKTTGMFEFPIRNILKKVEEDKKR